MADALFGGVVLSADSKRFLRWYYYGDCDLTLRGDMLRAAMRECIEAGFVIGDDAGLAKGETEKGALAAAHLRGADDDAQ